MLLTVVLTLVLVAVSVFIHYEVLRATSIAMPKFKAPPRRRLQLVIGAAIFAHLLEIGLFAVTYALMQNSLDLGRIVGPFDGSWLDFFYFSTASYTTLGMGDLVPEGPMRFMVSVQSLLGLVLIGWSASFTYLAMREFWDLH